MHAFTDGAKRTWELKITVTSMRRVKELADFDLAGALDDKCKPLMELLGNPERLAQVLYALCKPQLDEKAVSADDFGDALYGDPLEAAGMALATEAVSFFPNPRLREQMLKAFEKGRAVTALVLDEQDQRIEKLDPQALATAYIASHSRSAASSDSTPDRSASGN
jgi:hypothetical protein